MIGDPSSSSGGVIAEKKNSQVWPSEEKPWEYWDGSQWQQDTQLTVSGQWKLYAEWSTLIGPDVEILCPDWSNLTMLVPRSMP